MKTNTVILGAAVAIAAGLILIPRRAGAAGQAVATPGPRVGAGDAGAMWSSADSRRYRDQLAASVSSDWTGP